MISIKLCAILFGVATINIVLGAVQGGMSASWDWKKFIFGIIKAVTLTACIAGFCFILELIPQVFAEAGIEIDQDLVTLTQVFIVLGATIKKYATDVYIKIQEILES